MMHSPRARKGKLTGWPTKNNGRGALGGALTDVGINDKFMKEGHGGRDSAGDGGALRPGAEAHCGQDA